VGGAAIYSVDVLITGIVCLGLGLFILRVNPYLKISQLYVITMSMVAIYSSAMFLLHNAVNDDMASLFTRYVMLSGVLVAASVLYLSMYPPYEIQESWLIKKKRDFLLISFIATFIAAVIPNEVLLGENGYWWVPDAWSIIWLMMLGVFSIPPILFLNKVWDRSEDEWLKRHCTIISIALLMPFIFTVLDMFLAWSLTDVHNVLPIGLLTTGFIFAYTILNYKPFGVPSFKQEKENGSVKAPQVSLVSGHCDLILGKKADASYRMFIDEMERGGRGLLITNLHPNQVKEKYGDIKAPIMWLSGQPGQDRLDPIALTIIQHTMVDFLQKGENSILLLDGLDYLISENQLDKVLKIIYAVHDAVVVSGAKFIVPIDPRTIEAKDLAFIEKEFVVIDETAG
jgi:hypothetical protein